MKKFFYLGAALMLMASCGSSETTKESIETPDSFGYEMPPEAIELPEEYEGTGNMSDADEKANSDSKSVGDTEEAKNAQSIVNEVKEDANKAAESAKDKAKQIEEKANEGQQTIKETAKKVDSKIKMKANDMGNVVKETLPQAPR